MANSRKSNTKKNWGRNFGRARNKGPVPEISRIGRRIVRTLAYFAELRRWALAILRRAIRRAVASPPVLLLAEWSVTTSVLSKAAYRSNRGKDTPRSRYEAHGVAVQHAAMAGAL
jgi:hypothetical protein